jgi:hypothetical protein
MFKSEVTNKVLNIIFLLLLMTILLFNNLGTLFNVLVVPAFAARTLYDLYQIMKIQKQKAD